MGGPFGLDDAAAYRRWRDAKLADYPAAAADLVVAVRHLAAPTAVERAAILGRCHKANLAIYAGPADAGKDAIRAFAAAFGLVGLDRNMLADDDGFTPLAVAEAGRRQAYIPYTDRRLAWHTDGYYNPPPRPVRAMVLHCVRPAAEGGANRLMDPEIAYIRLRDTDPAHIAALMQADAMTIPPNREEGAPDRPASVGPVFSFDQGALHMRYTARTRSIAWKDDAATHAARHALEAVLRDETRFLFRHRLAPGQGIICNNVLHDRQAFADTGHRRRLAYRARYHDRIAGTERPVNQGSPP